MFCAWLFPPARVIGKGVRCQNCFERPERHDFSRPLFSEPFQYRIVVIQVVGHGSRNYPNEDPFHWYISSDFFVNFCVRRSLIEAGYYWNPKIFAYISPPTFCRNTDTFRDDEDIH